jgi:hypothetical protein
MSRLDTTLGPFIAGFAFACVLYVGTVVTLTFVWWA